MYNKVILIGHLTRDVEFRYTPRGTAVAKFGIATNRRFKDSTTGEMREETLFIDVTIFGKSAEFANQYFRKGKKILVEGRLALDQWTDQTGQKRSKHYIIAEKIQFVESRSSEEASGGYGGNYGGYPQGGGAPAGGYGAPSGAPYGSPTSPNPMEETAGGGSYPNRGNGGNYRGYTQPGAPSHTPQQTPPPQQPTGGDSKGNIPSIDIDDEDLPF